MYDETLNAWDVWELEFPIAHGADEKLRFLLRYAILAPSNRNTQPWLWKIENGTAQLHADLSRALPVADPDHRQLIVSCGATLLLLRLAVRHFGYRDEVEVCPDQHRPQLLAQVRLGERQAASVEEDLLFWAIPKRHTNRGLFEPRSLPPVLLARLQAEARREDAWLHFIEGDVARSHALELIARGDVAQWHDKEFRRETAAWLRPNRPGHPDGIPGYAQGMNDLAAWLSPLTAQMLDLGESKANKDSRLAASAPVLAVLGTDDDAPADWLATGQALARVLLRASAAGVAASFFNQPIEVTGLWPQLRHILDRDGFPQLLFRLGYAQAAHPTPRRSVDEVLVPDEPQEPTSREPAPVYSGPAPPM